MTELLSPCHDFTTLTAAIQGGCDAVYFGLKELNMRPGLHNFDIKDFPAIAKQCHENGIKAYLTLNTIVYDDELAKIKEIITAAKKAGIDALVCWDTAVLLECLRQKIPVHLSTQASVSNMDAVRFYKKNYNVKRIILARELSLEQIANITKQIKKENLGVGIEVFVHGAMCMSISGRCFLSQFTFGKSANRGTCLQNCRRAYRVTDTDNEGEFELHNNYILSAKDLCCLPFLDKIVAAGVTSLKVEGRTRSPEYVMTVTKTYRQALELIKQKEFSNQEKNKLIAELGKVYNRSFSAGFYLGKPLNEWSSSGGNASKIRKIFIGKIGKFYKKISVFEIEISAKGLKQGDKVIVQGPTTGSISFTVEEMQINHKCIKTAKKGQKVAVKSPIELKRNDEVYIEVRQN